MHKLEYVGFQRKPTTPQWRSCIQVVTAVRCPDPLQEGHAAWVLGVCSAAAFCCQSFRRSPKVIPAVSDGGDGSKRPRHLGPTWDNQV